MSGIFGVLGSILGIGGGSKPPSVDPAVTALQSQVLSLQQQVLLEQQPPNFDALLAKYKVPILIGGGALALLMVMKE